MSTVCRLCLNSSSDNYQEWKTIDQKYFQVVLPEIDLDMINSSVLCSNCLELLRTAYLFKSNCLETERLIKTYIERVGGTDKISLSDVLKGDFFSKEDDVKPDSMIKIESNEIVDGFFDDFSDKDEPISDDDKRYACAACNMSFEDEGSLKRHKHMGALRCAICNKDYSNAYNLRRHMLAHKKNGDSISKSGGEVEKCGKIEEVAEKVLEEMEAAVKKHDEAYKDEFDHILLCEICRESFDTKRSLLEHIRSHFAVKCERCGRYYKDSVALERHKTDSHGGGQRCADKIFSCDICYRTYGARKYLLAHIRTHFERPRCKLCDRTYYDIGCLKRHLATVHKAKINILKKSDEEGKEFDDVDFEVDEANMMAALNKHLDMYQTRNANSDNTTNNGNDEHCKSEEVITNSAEDRSFHCEICNKIYAVKRHLDDHMMTHFCRPMCTLCNKAYYNHQCLKRHMSTVHDVEIDAKPIGDVVKLEYLDDLAPCSICNNPICTCNNSLKCNICGKIMGNRSSFIRHKLTHSKRKNFICDFCQKGFLTKLYLQRHINTTHLGVPRKRTSNHIFTCDTCGLTTNNKHTLIQHIRTHTGERPYKCDQCGKAFVQSSTLGTHKRTVHSTERLFTCEYCSKSFNTKGSLTKHILEVHMVDKIEKKFVCNFCGKKYRLQSQLTCHLKWHSSDRQFSCDICGKPFVDRHSVKKHRVIHFNEKQHKCEICGKGFHQKYNIKIHMKVHSRVP